MPEFMHVPLIIIPAILSIVMLIVLGTFLVWHVRWWKKFRNFSEMKQKITRLQGEISYLTALNQGMAELGSIRCFAVDAKTLEIIHQCGEASGRFSKIHSLEVFSAGMHEENRAHFLEKCRKLLSGQISEFHEEYRYKVGKGYRRIMEYAKMLPVEGQAGKILLLVDMDISNLEERTFHWGDTEQLLNSIFSDSPGYIFLKTCDEKFTYTRCNNAFAAMVGMTPQEVCGKNDGDLFPQDMALRIQASNLEAVRNSSVTHKWYLSAPNGRQIAMMCVQRLLHGKDGADYLLGMGMDISGMEHVERTIRRRNQVLRMLVNALPCEMMLLDKDLFILTGNNAMVEAFNVPIETMRQHRGTELDSGFGELDPIKLAAGDHQPHTAANERYQLSVLPVLNEVGDVTAYAVWRTPADSADEVEPQEAGQC